jgi:molecular chaperone GrpE
MTHERRIGGDPRVAPGAVPAGPPEPEAAGEPAAERAPGGDLADAERRAQEYLDNWKRSAAEFDNFRKRMQRESAQQAARGIESLVSELLPVLDNLERALDASDHHEPAKVADGVKLVHQQLADLLGRRGVEEIDAEPGQPFDPHVHEALSQTPSEHPEGAIASVWQRGYRAAGKVVRPARVVVSSGPAAAPDEG